MGFHPLATGSVAYVSGREGVLGAANYFLALNFFLYGFFAERIVLAMVAYGLFFLFTAIGILSNPQCLTLPFFAAGLIFLLKTPDVSVKEWLLERGAEIIALLFVGICSCYLLTFGAPAGHRQQLWFGAAGTFNLLGHAIQDDSSVLFALWVGAVWFGDLSTICRHGRVR